MNESFNPQPRQNPTYDDPVLLPLQAGDRIVAPIGGPGVVVKLDEYVEGIIHVRLDADDTTYRYPGRLLQREEAES